MSNLTLNSWGNYPRIQPARVMTLNWRDDNIPFQTFDQHFLAYGQGRSYGDSCLNENGIILRTERLNHLISFDHEHGILECEAGVTLADILDIITPHGWFLPVLPGTQYVSVGGAIANDIHGKNHHRMGTFGRHILSFELLRSDGQRLLCSLNTHSSLFQATIGGLGLTGIILSAKIQLRRIHSLMMDIEYLTFSGLDEFFTIAADSEKTFEYTVAWLDCINSGKKLGRGIFMRANHHPENSSDNRDKKSQHELQIPCYLPKIILNRFTIGHYNDLYYYLHARKSGVQCIPYEKFFFPLDAIHHWNRIYGKNGLVQYQCVLPPSHYADTHNLLATITAAKQPAFLAVIKTFGGLESPGMLSFPRQGVTLAFDLPYRGVATRQLLQLLDAQVVAAKGRVYPAKDASMSPLAFKRFFPQWQDFSRHIDPKFSSSFWRRVMNNDT